MKIGITNFALRHFDSTFKGTVISSDTPDKFLGMLSTMDYSKEFIPGYADFCKHLVGPNFTNARLGAIEITPTVEHLIKTGYVSRRPEELPVLQRWYTAGHIPCAQFLDIILYSTEQLKLEGEEILHCEDPEWGIVSINGIPSREIAPMPPITHFRNALGVAEGGSGSPLDKEEYLRSVAYWSKYVLVEGVG